MAPEQLLPLAQNMLSQQHAEADQYNAEMFGRYPELFKSPAGVAGGLAGARANSDQNASYPAAAK
jgi:hypothetical protein